MSKTATIAKLIPKHLLPACPTDNESFFAIGGKWVIRGCYVPDAHDRATILQPTYFRKVANQLHLGDRIELRNRSLTLWMDLIVVEHDAVGEHVIVEVLAEKTLPKRGGSRVAGTGTYSYEWVDAVDKWQIVRKSDGQVMAKGFDQERDAQHHVVSKLMPQRDHTIVGQ